MAVTEQGPMEDSAVPAADEKARQPAAGRPHFRRSNTPKLAPEKARRQGIVTRLALETLGNKDEAMAYLNSVCDRLGSRPLDLAIASADGLRQVERDLTLMRSGAPAIE